MVGTYSTPLAAVTVPLTSSPTPSWIEPITFFSRAAASTTNSARRVPTYTFPSATSGEPQTSPSALWDHRPLPVALSTQ